MITMPNLTTQETRARLLEIHENIKTGYIEYGMYFWIISISVIIGSFVHLAGVAAFILTVTLFYWAGQAHSRLRAASPPPKQ